jgi:hypothetical protein
LEGKQDAADRKKLNKAKIGNNRIQMANNFRLNLLLNQPIGKPGLSWIGVHLPCVRKGD